MKKVGVVEMNEKVRDNVIVPIVAALITGVLGLWGGSQITETRIGNEVNVIINQNGAENSASLKSDDLVEAFRILQDKNEASEIKINSLTELNKSVEAELRSKDRELLSTQNMLKNEEEKNAQLKEENTRLVEENKKIKDILLQDNSYADTLDDLIKLKKTSKRLEDLHLIDSDRYEMVQALVDSHGNPHTYVYKFRTDSTAFARYKLNGQYDVFTAYAVTGQDDTSREAALCVEIWVDNQRVAQYTNITTAKESYKIGPIVVRNADELKIVVARMAGGYESLYIVDESLEVAE